MDASVARILLVDDRPENLLALEATLEPLHQQMVRAASGEEALFQLLRADFAVILLDVQMPRMNGFELAEIIKSREKTRHTPIIFMTAISKEQEFVHRGYSVGAVDYISKPFQPEMLRSKVAVFVDLWLMQDKLQRQQEQLRQAQRRELELKHHDELRQSETRIAEIVRHVDEAIITFGTDLMIATFNSGAERIFGYAAGSMQGQAIDTLLHPDSRPDFAQRLETLVQSQGNGTIQWAGAGEGDLLAGMRKNSEAFPLEASVSRLVVADGPVFTIIGRDVSERRRSEIALRNRTVELARASAKLEALNQELNDRTRDLEKALSARSRFYASMSHELRTPINAILGYSSLLLDQINGTLNEAQSRMVERTNRAATHLIELVNDLLDLSKIEAGKIELKLEPVTFPRLVEDMFATIRPMADEYGSSVSCQHAGDPITIISDPRRVRQILLNLLSNAIKFGRGRPIKVISQPAGGDGVEIQVIDQGVGIAQVDQNKIFDEFVQLGCDRQDGTGLGLPISKRLAVILNGMLTVESEEDVGSLFRLQLPRMSSAIVDHDLQTMESELMDMQQAGGGA
ncbi:MAG: hybrid sensor histidine kinase/response regulator [Longimicrobiales bacterium]